MMGLHRHPHHGVELLEWAPGAQNCSIVGDFNTWDESAHQAPEPPFGRDDDGCFRIFIPDELRPGLEQDELGQEYSYDRALDRGDERSPKEQAAALEKEWAAYWKPGEDQFLHEFQDPKGELMEEKLTAAIREADIAALWDDEEDVGGDWDEEEEEEEEEEEDEEEDEGEGEDVLDFEDEESEEEEEEPVGWEESDEEEEAASRVGRDTVERPAEGASSREVGRALVKSEMFRAGEGVRDGEAEPLEVSEHDWVRIARQSGDELEDVSEDFDGASRGGAGLRTARSSGGGTTLKRDAMSRRWNPRDSWQGDVDDADWKARGLEQGAHLGWANGMSHYEPGTDGGESEPYVKWSTPDGRTGRLPKIEVDVSGLPIDGEPTLVSSPEWAEYVRGLAAPYPYWEAERRGRVAWEKKYSPVIPHGAKYRVALETAEGGLVERVSAWAVRAVPDDEASWDWRRWSAVMWDPPLADRHEWVHPAPASPASLRVYEAHVGISADSPGIGTFSHFTDKVLPHVVRGGYNALLLVGIQEHPDYSTAGAKASSLYAVSSRFGTPEDLKRLVDAAHGQGVVVLMDVHHACVGPYETSGLLNFDGRGNCFIAPGKRAVDPVANTRIPHYGDFYVLQFLLSNLRWWVEEYRIDGFRFRSLPSMMYVHNGHSDFEKGVAEYFGAQVNEDAIEYLILANDMLQKLKPDVITIADDFTFYPGLCHPTRLGGLGFKFWVRPGPAQMWAWLLENAPVMEWSMAEIMGTLIAPQNDPAFPVGPSIAFTEDHSQTFHPNRPLSSNLLWGSSEDSSTATAAGSMWPAGMPAGSAAGMCLYKVIRLITLACSDPAFMSSMGTEFAQPEAVEFPCRSNDMSFARAFTRWDLLGPSPPHGDQQTEGGGGENAQSLRSWHQCINAFDQAMMDLAEEIHSSPPPNVLLCCETRKVVCFVRGRLLFSFCFHPSQPHLRLPVPLDQAGAYQLVLDSDSEQHGGTLAERAMPGGSRRQRKNEARAQRQPRQDAAAGQLGGGFIVHLDLLPLSCQVFRLTRVLDLKDLETL